MRADGKRRGVAGAGVGESVGRSAETRGGGIMQHNAACVTVQQGGGRGGEWDAEGWEELLHAV
eukprot:51113-Chlamydomonas_euryale.AAC.1